MAHKPWHRGYRYRRARAITLAQSTICWLCGHDGADTVDHVLSPMRGGDWYDLDNLRPAHGVRGCPVCERKCNRAKGTKTVAEMGPRSRRSRAW